jgi:hypothetical protein
MLVMPRFVAITRTGAKSLSIARFNQEKHSTMKRKKVGERGDGRRRKRRRKWEGERGGGRRREKEREGEREKERES